MSDETEELLKFPCEIAVKAMGQAEEGFVELVVEIVRKHAPDLGNGAVTSRPSGKGNFLAVTVRVNAQSRIQMDAIYQDLCDHEKVKIAL